MENRIRVLIVDDTDPVRESLCEFLGDCGFAADGAGAAVEAIEYLEKNPVDAVVVDLSLPGENGEGFIRQALQRWPEMRFLIFTGAVDFDIPEDLAKNSRVFPEILTKPILNLEVLSDTIRQLVSRT